MRALVRVQNLWRLLLAAIAGLIGGAVVELLNVISLSMHRLLFHLSGNGHLSSLKWVNPVNCIVIPILGGGCLWLIRKYLARYFSAKIVDVIEANALYGGKVSVRDSLYITLQTLSSNGFGISLGLESAYTQLSAAFASKIGRFFRIQQSDLRIMVGCGAAGAIGAAFNSIMGGAFYGFEIVLSAYTLINFPFVMIAAISGVVMIGWLGGSAPIFHIAPSVVHPLDYGLVCIFALLCAGIGIGVMYAATQLEIKINKLRINRGLTLLTGGLLVGLMGLVTPGVLGSGHGVLWVVLAGGIGFKLACIILVLKVFASAISLGSGFRGGLFFASMLLGGSAGIVFGNLMILMGIHTVSPLVYAAIGMAVSAATVIGGPMSMMFIALDMTNSFAMTGMVVLAVIVSVITVRKTFGYSFATWRFHIRGEDIRSALDISWLKKTTVKGLMVPVPVLLRDSMTVREARQRFLEEQQDFGVLYNAQGGYSGLISLKSLYEASSNPEEALSQVAYAKDRFVTENMNLKEALDFFENNEGFSWMAVVQDRNPYQIVGIIFMDDLLKRYNEILERQVKDLTGTRL